MVIHAALQDDIAQLSPSYLVRYLIDVVGAPLVAVMAGVRSAGEVERWSSGQQAPEPDAERRLRDAYRVVQTLLEADGPDVVRGWLIGMNPMLEDQAPGLVLADDPDSVLFAARAYRYGQMGA